MAAVIISTEAWQTMTACIGTEGAPYASLLGAVLDTAAKSILTRRIGEMSVFPTEIDDAIFSADAILTEATSGNSDWLSKEELTQAWEASVTRNSFTNDPRYLINAQYRKAVSAFADLVIKLAGKTSTYTESELDTMQVKMKEEDHDSELMAFMNRRIEQIRNKPAKPAFDMDLL
jgi:lipid II:glycine glycyltransferase (peptidoglycan interpeptide bridge formation enzyme)